MKNPVEMLKEIKNLLGVELTSEKVEAAEAVEAKKSEVILAQLKLENGTVLESEDFKKDQQVFILTEDEQVALPVGEYLLEDGRTLNVTEDGVINSIEVKAEEAEPENENMDEELYPTREEFNNLKSMVESMKEMMGEDYGKKKEDKMEEEAELKEELSKPASAPIKHNPEKKETKKVLYSQKRGSTTLDIVMNKILNK